MEILNEENVKDFIKILHEFTNWSVRITDNGTRIEVNCLANVVLRIKPVIAQSFQVDFYNTDMQAIQVQFFVFKREWAELFNLLQEIWDETIKEDTKIQRELFEIFISTED